MKNAEREHKRCPFHAILVKDIPDRSHLNKAVFKGSNLKHDITEWNHETMVTVERKAKDMAKAVSPMLSNCTEAIFIDPHFDPEKDKYRVTIKAFLQEIVNHRCTFSPKRIEVHASDRDDKPSFDEFSRRCNDNNLRSCIPKGMTVCFKRWKEKQNGEHEKLHNRFILTNIGGVAFLFGLDEGDGSDIVVLLTRKVYEQIWEQYAESNPAFDLDDSVEIEGTA
ncbi:hypothetical protein QUF72_02545 [Desulfobacterales bacterium HSG2]|nr:hypothetical protein [Desulfobacterales bacterium HSG2]